MKTYAEKLKDPRWQRKRLEIMSERDFRCEICQDSTQELHIHHKEYATGRNPWEYESWKLECLCSDCHSMSHIAKEKIHQFHRMKKIGIKNMFIADKLFPRIFLRHESLPFEAKIRMVNIRIEGVSAFKEFRKEWNARFLGILKNQGHEAQSTKEEPAS